MPTVTRAGRWEIPVSPFPSKEIVRVPHPQAPARSHRHAGPRRRRLVGVGGGRTGKKVKAPVPQSWFGSPGADSVAFQSHPVYGFMCPILKPDVDAP